MADTINHVLDFSKINSFERNLQTARVSERGRIDSRVGSSASAQVPPGSAPPLLNIYAITDVAAICGKYNAHIEVTETKFVIQRK